MTKDLFDPIKLGDIALSNRMIMAPLTRGRAGESRVPNDLMVEYYKQRAEAGMIITEATAISAQGYGWYGAPAIYTDAMEDAWRTVTESVHGAGGKIVLQLWHMGRMSHPDFLNGALPVSSSDVAAKGEAHTAEGKKPYVAPRPLDKTELPAVIEDYTIATQRAMKAGFDGVEIHAANGYLLDQFIRDSANRRTDEYGGSIENRLRFPLEVVKAVSAVAGPGRTGIRLSPNNPNGGMTDSDPVATFTAMAEALNPYNLAYVHVMEPFNQDHSRGAPGTPYVTPSMREVYKGNLIVNGGYGLETGNEAIAEKRGDAVAFGVPFLANPDLVTRFKEKQPLNKPDIATFYSGGPEGYTDYPVLKRVA